MAIIIVLTFASGVKPPLGCADPQKHFCEFPCLYKQFGSFQISSSVPCRWPNLTPPCKTNTALGGGKYLLTRLPFQSWGQASGSGMTPERWVLELFSTWVILHLCKGTASPAAARGETLVRDVHKCEEGASEKKTQVL